MENFDLRKLQDLINTIWAEIQRAGRAGEPAILSFFSKNQGNSGVFVLNLCPNNPEALKALNDLIDHMKQKQDEILGPTRATIQNKINEMGQGSNVAVKEPEKTVFAKMEKQEDGSVNIIFDKK